MSATLKRISNRQNTPFSSITRDDHCDSPSLPPILSGFLTSAERAAVDYFEKNVSSSSRHIVLVRDKIRQSG